MPINKNIVLERNNQKPILIDTFYSEEITNQPIVIFCHGYKGFKDWGAWNLMAKRISESGLCFIKFNFSHNGGTIKDPIDFPDLKAFGNNNYSKEVNDLTCVIDWVETEFKNNIHVNTKQMGLLGHSRGGGIAILKASQDLRIKKLITLASVCDFENRFGSKTEILKWQKDRVKFVTNGRTKQQMPHYFQFYEDFMSNKTQLNIEAATKKLNIPHLIIHGDKDNSVSINEAKALQQWNPKAEFKIVKNTDHVFNTKHPWHKEDLSAELKTVSQLITAFVGSSLIQLLLVYLCY